MPFTAFRIAPGLRHARLEWSATCAVKPVTNDHPLGPEKAVFSGKWSLGRGLHRIPIIMNVRPSVPCEVVFSTRLVASHGGL